MLSAKETGLPKDSVANVSQVVTVDKNALAAQVGRISKPKVLLILRGIDLLLGR